jgi:hypothetical protein
MATVTWRDLFAFEYGPGMPQPVDLASKSQPYQSPIVRELLALLSRATGLGAPSPTGPAEGWGRGAVTPHNIGAAVDIRYHTNNDTTRAFANSLIDLFIRHRGSLGWAYISYNYMHFDANRVNEAAGDKEHQDHVHIDWVDYARSKRSTALSSFTYRENNVVQTKKVDSGGQWVSMTSNGGADGGLGAAFTSAFERVCANASANVARHARFNASDFAAAYRGADSDSELAWLYGWWTVWDSNTYYYYFGSNGFVQYTKTKPGAKSPPPSQPRNRGMYSCSREGVLVIDWNPADGGATRETFRNAFHGAQSMNATSNRYGPLVGTKMV